MDTPTLLGYITLDTKVRIFNDLRAEIQGEAEECIFDLLSMAEWTDFSNLYGKETTSACSDNGRYWLGGMAYYAHVLEMSNVRHNPIKMVTAENIDELVLNAYAMIK